MRFIAFDLETTGFLPGVDQITEIGAARFIDGKIDAVYSTLVNPKKNISEGATKVTGINNEMLKNSPCIEDLLPSFADFCGEDLIIAHNAPFDMQFLSADIKKFESPAPKGIILDTFAMAKKILPGMANYKLGTLIQHFKIPNNEFHRAEADATYCGHLFLTLIKKISTNGQSPAIENLISLSNNKALKFPQITKQEKQLDMLSLL